ncbi:MAG: hypothetical protein Fur002_12890 [Anaerolineales bacterium]
MKKIPTFVSFSILFIGVLLGLTLATLAAWADLEANFYGFTRQSKTPFQGLSCPAMMTRGETKAVYIKVKNTAAKPISPNVRVEISTPLLPAATLDFLELEPGESAVIAKTISGKNIDLENFIFVKALVYAAYPMTDQEGTCGVYILPFEGSGKVWLSMLTLLSVTLCAAGAYLLRKSALPKQRVDAFLFLALLVFPALTFSLIGWWIQAGITLVIAALTFVVALGGLAGS